MLRIVIAGLLLSANAFAQTVPEQTLGKPLARSSEGFTDIVGVSELPDATVIAADLRERRVVRIDFARGTSKDIARQGQGPSEFTGTFALLPWLGDTVLVYGHTDLLKISPAGRPVERVSTAMLLTGNGGLVPPHFADREGRIYFETTDQLKRGADGALIAATGGNVIRWRMGANRADTVGRIALRDPQQPLIRFWRPYGAQDASAVFPDGSVALVRAMDYHVEIWKDGRLAVQGPRVRYDRIAVTAAERDAYRDMLARQPIAGATTTSLPPGPSSSADREVARKKVGIPDEAFPPALPPITQDRTTLIDRSGLLWVRRSFPATTTDRWYDVFDTRGQLVRRVMIKNGGRVVGFGRGVVYVVTADADDIEWIERYTMQ